MTVRSCFFRNRRLVVASFAMAATGLLSIPTHTYAQAAYPTKPIRVVVGFAAGGPTDIQARILAEKLSPILKQPLVVENKPGASTTIAAGDVSRAAADGYTLFLGGSGAFSITPVTLPQLPYDPVKSFASVGLIGSEHIAIAINPAIPAKTLQEFADLVKANPGKYSFGSSGHGNITHLTGELFKLRAGNLDLIHVPYKGAAPAVNDLVAGHVAMIVGGLGSVYPMHQAGKLRVLAVASENRSPFATDIPTTRESGFPNLLSGNSSILLAPAGTPQAAIDALSNGLAQVSKDPDFIERMNKIVVEVVPNSTPAMTQELLNREIKQWADVVKSAGIDVKQK
jgi:tripartite-type tricarboxylate transporter receptor subunit TctC